MRWASLFSGYGGLDIGVMAALGGELAWFVEYDTAPSKILARHWPDVHNYGDVTTIDWAVVPAVEGITAGYPCQPFSLSGKRKGSNDERHLWPYVLEAVRHLRPRIVVLENVRGHLSLGFDRVLGDLAEAGYDTDWICVPAAAAGAPHRRERIFIVAHPADLGHEWTGEARHGRAGLAYGRDAAPDASSSGLGEHPGAAPSEEAWPAGSDELAGDGGPRPYTDWGPYLAAVERWERVLGRRAPAPTVHGRLAPEFVEWMMGLPAGHVTDVGLSRAQQLKALGNGVVPQHAALAVLELANRRGTDE